ncbi:MAG: hypothetical protein K8F60_04895 [Melioribacteraceae bacterium]|nr:hypothetical protein [Melioribacteraceae bacterium]
MGKVNYKIENLGHELLHGIASNIYDAEESLNIATEISKYSEEINNSRYKEYFGTQQRIFNRHAVLSTIKLFDRRKDTISIITHQKKIENIIDQLIFQNEQYLLKIIDSWTIFNDFRKLNKSCLPKDIFKIIKKNLPNENKKETDGLSEILYKVKFNRDKFIAHSSVLKINGDKNFPKKLEENGTKYSINELKHLLLFAKKYVSVSGMLFNFFYEVDGDYLLSNEASHTKENLRLLLSKANIIEQTERDKRLFEYDKQISK